MNIGKTLKRLRMKNGITQQQLADRLNVGMQTISRWETSATYPDVVMLPILARYFRVSVDYLLGVGGNAMKTTTRITPRKRTDSSWTTGLASLGCWRPSPIAAAMKWC